LSLSKLNLSTLFQVRTALGAAQKRKLSFKNVSNVVVQLLHSIKYSMEVPFSNMGASDIKGTAARRVRYYFHLGPLIIFQLVNLIIKYRRITRGKLSDSLIGR